MKKFFNLQRFATTINLTKKADNYENTTFKTPVTINKANSLIKVDGVKNITYGGILNLEIGLTNSSNGTYKLYHNNIFLKQDDLTDKITLTDLNAGNYTIEISNNVDENHIKTTKTVEFKVIKAQTQIISQIINMVYTNNITIPFSADGTGNITVTITGNKTKINKTVSIEEKELILFLDAGEYNITLNYSGDLNYNATSKTSNFTIYKAQSSITVENITNITYGENLTLKAILINGTNGRYHLFFNNTLILEDNLTFNNL